MPEFKIKMPDGQIRTVSGPDREGAMAFAKANYRPTTVATPAPTVTAPAPNRSLADGLEYGDLGARANVAGYLGDANQELEDGPIGSMLNWGTENIARPIRGAIGLETKSRQEIADAFSAEQSLREQNLRQSSADLNYDPMTTKDVKGPLSALQFAATKTAESIGPMTAAIASGGALTPLLGAGEVNNNLKDIEGLSREERIRLATSGGALYAVLENLGIGMLLKGVPKEVVGKLGTKGITALLEKNGLGRLTKAVTAGFASEAVTEAAQEGVSIGAEAIAGKEFEDGEIGDRLFESAAAGGAGGGTIRGSIQAGTEVANIGQTVWSQNMADPEYGAAASDLARLLRSISDAEGLNLKDVKTQGAAKQTLEAAHEQISGQIKAIVGAPGVRERLSPKNAETLDQLLEDYAAATTAVRQGKNKVKSKVTDENGQAMARLLGPTQEAGQLLNLFAQGNVLTDLFADGTKGGVSQFTDFLNPLQNDGGGGFNVYRGLNVLGGVAGATQFGIPATVGIIAGGRAIDAVTGRRSKVNRFVKKLEKLTGQEAPQGPSLIAAAALERQQAEQAKVDDAVQKATQAEQKAATEAETANITGTLAGITGNATDGSPLGTIAVGTGIDPQEIQTVISELRLKHPADSKKPEDVDINKVLDDAQAGLNGEQKPIRALTQLVNLVNNHLNADLLDGGSSVQRTSLPDQPLAQAQAIQRGNVPTMDAAPTQPQAPTAPSAMTQATTQPTVNGNQTTTPENYQAGKQANQDFALNLQEQVMDTLDLAARQASNRPEGGPTVEMLDTEAEALYIALESVQTENMPIEVMEEVQQALLEEGVSQENVDKFYKPYVDRARRQQKNKPSMLAQAQATQQALSDQPRSDDSRSVPEMPPPPRQFGEKTDVSLETSLSNAFQTAQTKMYAKGRDFKLDLQAQSLAAQEREGIDLNTLDDANIDRLADFAVVDALEALKDNENAIGWYGRTVTAALNSVAELHPEVLTDPKAKMQFIWATAVTSNGLKVDKNMDLALDVYEAIKTTGRMPTNMGIGKSAKAINQGLQKYHTMLEKFQRMSNTDEGAHALLDEFMNGKFPLKELQKEHGVKISGESANTLIRGSAILGPKIGGGFYSNLYGNFDELTMDRWLMRSVGRWRGGLVKINKPMIVKKTKEIQSLLETADLKALKPLFKKSGVFPRKKMSKDMVHLFSEVIAKESMDPAWREQINAIPGGEELRKSGNGLAGYLDGQVEMPAGPKERDFIRSVFTKALDRLQNAPEIRNISNEPLNMSDLQALLWYPEKRLYDTAKQKDGESRGYKDDEAPDYANAAKTSVGNRLGSTGAVGYGGRGPSATNEGPTSDNSIQPALLSPPGPAGGRAPGSNAVTGPTTKGRTLARVALTAVKRFVPEAKVPFQVGKRGTKYENGIQTLDQALYLAQTLGITVRLFDSQEEAFASRYAIDKNADRDAEASFYLKGPSDGGKGAEGTIFGLNPGALLDNGGRVSGIEALSNVIHEIAHGMTLGPLDLNGSQVNDTPFTNPVTGQTDRAPAGSFAGSALRPLLEGKGDPDIMSEIDNLQLNVDAYTTNDPAQRSALRGVRQLMDSLDDWKDYYQKEVDAGLMSEADAAAGMGRRQANMDYYTDYMQGIRELAVDPVLIYLINPKLAKAVMPKTAALIREQFNNAGNNKVKFYSHPMAVVIATVMAMLAQGMAEEEEEKQQMQMPPGALSPPPPGMGALTA